MPPIPPPQPTPPLVQTDFYQKGFFLTLIFSKPIALKPIMWFVWFMNWEWASSKIALCGRCTVVNPSATAF